MRIIQHIGLVKDWKYLGAFETDVPLAKIARKKPGENLRAVNQAYGTSFTRCTIQEIKPTDYTAGHVSTLAAEIEEACQ